GARPLGAPARRRLRARRRRGSARPLGTRRALRARRRRRVAARRPERGRHVAKADVARVDLPRAAATSPRARRVALAGRAAAHAVALAVIAPPWMFAAPRPRDVSRRAFVFTLLSPVDYCNLDDPDD